MWKNLGHDNSITILLSKLCLKIFKTLIAVWRRSLAHLQPFLRKISYIILYRIFFTFSYSKTRFFQQYNSSNHSLTSETFHVHEISIQIYPEMCIECTFLSRYLLYLHNLKLVLFSAFFDSASRNFFFP